MCKQHLNALSIVARLLECLGLGQRSGNVSRLLIDAARNLALRRLWAAFGFERARATIMGACEIKKCLPIVDQLARRRKGLSRWAGIDVALLVEREVLS